MGQYAYEINDTVSLFHKIANIMYLGCGTNFMFGDLQLPAKFMKIFKHVSKLFELLVIILISSQWGAFFTQKNLTIVEKSNLFLYGPTSLTLYAMYLNAVYRKEQIKKLSYTLAVTLKGMYTDAEIEKRMIKKSWRFIIAMASMVYGLFFSTAIVTGYTACTTNATFTTMIPAWPDLSDRSAAAGVSRIAYYVVWYLFITRVGSIYFIILVIAIALQHQYSIMYEYFLSLNRIFDEEGSQDEKEKKYEDGLKLGIKMHSLTLWCIGKTQETCGLAFSSQVIANVLALILLMVQWMNMERTFGNCLNIFLFAGVMLIGTGLFMWNAGDISFEYFLMMLLGKFSHTTHLFNAMNRHLWTAMCQAAKLPTAMFHSGWYNCRGHTSAQVRKLLTIAIQQAQDRVVIKGFGIMELSYESYISIVKSSYSVFSVMY